MRCHSLADHEPWQLTRKNMKKPARHKTQSGWGDARCVCTSGPDCSGEAPSECSSGCADVLLPLLEHCSSYLLLPDNTALHSLLVDAASRCGGGGGH